jgi:hypothetical protein
MKIDHLSQLETSKMKGHYMADLDVHLGKLQIPRYLFTIEE